MTFDEQIHAWLDAIDGDLVVPVEAGKFAAQSNDDELREWLWQRREVILADRMGDIMRTERSTIAARRKSRVFAVALVELQIARDDWTDALAAHEPQAASEAFSRWWRALRQLQEAG